MTTQGFAAPTRKGKRGSLPVNADPNADLAPFVPSSQDPWDARKAAHLLRRAGFGGRPGEIDAVGILGMDRTVDILLSAPPRQLQDRGIAVLPHGEVLDISYNLGSQRAAWLYEMVNGFWPLQEKLTLFWHDHWSVGGGSAELEQLLPAHINTLRRHALGSFRDMVIAVTKDPAMLYWLDNHLNGRLVNGNKQVNENYGRELLELYTMGVTGGYTQQDVVEVSKCLSGWTLEYINVFKFDPGMHIDGDKTVLGRRVASAGEQEVFDLVDNVILPWPATAEYIVKKLWEYFVAPQPYPALITELANRFRSMKFDIRSLMSVILRSNYFYSANAIGMLIKNPVEFAIGAMRNLNTPIENYVGLGNQIAALGYPLLRYENPSGLPDGNAWINSQTMLARGNFANELTRLSSTAALRNRFDHWAEIGGDPRYSPNPPRLRTAEEVVDHYLKILVDGDVPDSVRASLYDFMNRIDTGSAPFNFGEATVQMKVRGLVHLILALPEYSAN